MSGGRRPGWLADEIDIFRELGAGDWAAVGIVTLAAAAAGFFFLMPPAAVAVTVLGALAVTVASADARLMAIPDLLSLALFGSGVAASAALAAADPFPLYDWPLALGIALAGALAGGATLLALRLLWQRARQVEAMGFGDVKLAAGVGAWLGPVDIFLAFAVAAFAGLALVAAARRRRRPSEGADRLPFAALLAPAAWIVFFIARLPG